MGIVGLDGRPLRTPKAVVPPEIDRPAYAEEDKLEATVDEQEIIDKFNAHMSLTEGRRYIQLNIFLNNYMKLLPGEPTMEQTLQVFGMDLHEILHTHKGSFRTAIYGKTGRNDKCPCGSNEKYKKCCLLKHDTVVNVKTTAPNPAFDDGITVAVAEDFAEEAADLGTGAGMMGEQIDIEDAIEEADNAVE